MPTSGHTLMSDDFAPLLAAFVTTRRRPGGFGFRPSGARLMGDLNTTTLPNFMGKGKPKPKPVKRPKKKRKKQK
jgi:hypothetical protein